jgi:hypothetical protein
VADQGAASGIGSEPRLRRVLPDGRILTVAGTGRFSPDPTRQDELRGDGMAAVRADLRRVQDVAVLPDGGIVFSEGLDSLDRGPAPDPGLVRYLPPPSGARPTVAVRRDRFRAFATGRSAQGVVSLTAPADVTVTVADRAAEVARVTRAALPAGNTTVALPALPRRALTIRLVATDAAARAAVDTAPILPRGGLSDALGRSVAVGTSFAASHADGLSGDGLGRCRRFAPSRVDCEIVPETRCAIVTTVRLGSEGAGGGAPTAAQSAAASG